MKGLGNAHVPLSDENMAVSAAMVAGKSAGRLVVGQVRVDPRPLFQAYKEAGANSGSLDARTILWMLSREFR